MYQVVLVGGRKMWVNKKAARDLQMKGRVLYVLKESIDGDLDVAYDGIYVPDPLDASRAVHCPFAGNLENIVTYG